MPDFERIRPLRKVPHLSYIIFEGGMERRKNRKQVLGITYLEVPRKTASRSKVKAAQEVLAQTSSSLSFCYCCVPRR